MRMVFFTCEECGLREEYVVEDPSQEEVKCESCGGRAINSQTPTDNIHRDGNHYNHVTWSTWNNV